MLRETWWVGQPRQQRARVDGHRRGLRTFFFFFFFFLFFLFFFFFLDCC